MLVFCHSGSFLGRAIRWAERVRRDGEASGAAYNHVAWIDHWDQEVGDWIVGEADSRGVTCDQTLYSLAGATGHYTVLRVSPYDVDIEESLDFWRAQIGRKYGYVTIASIFFTLFTPKFLNVMLPDTWICSAVAAEGLRAGGWLHNWSDIYQVSPAELWLALDTEGQ
jgi:hypothetical protein